MTWDSIFQQASRDTTIEEEEHKMHKSWKKYIEKRSQTTLGDFLKE